MTKTATLLLAALLLSASMCAQKAAKPAQRLQQSYPNIEWKVQSATTVDIDGKPDTFLWGIDPQVAHTYQIHVKLEKYVYPEVVLGFDFGSGKKPQTLNIPFWKNTGYYGFRTVPTKIEVQPLSCDWEGRRLPGCVEQERRQSMWVRDGDPFEAYVFGDSEQKAVSWLRH